MVRHKSRSNVLKRGSKNIEPHVSLRIYCNGKTEKTYFQDLSEDLRLRPFIQVNDKRYKNLSSYNRLSLVKYCQDILKEDGYKPDDHHEVWVVFDVDALPYGQQQNPAEIQHQADEAVKLCRKLKYHPIVSNDAFELWFLLHFNYDSSHLYRSVLLNKVREKIPVYEKAGSIYDTYLKDKTDTAIKNSKKLCEQYEKEPNFVSACRPYTNVYELVGRMIRLAQEKKDKNFKTP